MRTICKKCILKLSIDGLKRVGAKDTHIIENLQRPFNFYEGRAYSEQDRSRTTNIIGSRDCVGVVVEKQRCVDDPSYLDHDGNTHDEQEFEPRSAIVWIHGVESEEKDGVDECWCKPIKPPYR